MKNEIRSLLLALVSLLAVACGGDTDPADTTATPAEDSVAMRSAPTEPELPASHSCQVEGEVLEDNQFWARREQVLVAITADSTTADPNLGPSHRVLKVYDTRTCEQIDRQVLPVNVSPDYPYYIAPILYNNVSHLVGISGFDELYVYNTEERRLLEPVEPAFLTRRPAADAQSGMIQQLEVWEDYIVGYAVDEGAFIFNMTDSAGLKPVLPFAEVRVDDDFRSLFLLPSNGGAVQALMPYYDYETEQFAINPLLSAPTRLSTNVPASARNNRFLVLRGEGNAGEVYAFDLQTRQRVDLPANVRTQQTQQILQWLRDNRR